MTCNCKCCCGCCCDGSTGSQTLESPCTAPKVFHGKGTICDVCCDLGEIRDDIDSEEDCPGTWVTNGRCLETPCETPCSGPCDEENPCPEGCECVDGECVAAVGCCCIGGSPDQSKTTQFSCESAGGTWNSGAACASAAADCRCCTEFKFLCITQFDSGDLSGVGRECVTEPPRQIPAEAGLIASVRGTVISCGTQDQYCNQICYSCGEEDGDGNFANVLRFQYTTLRAVDSCDDCSGTCVPWGDTSVLDNGYWELLCNCAASQAVNPCADNPLP
jgi:hypothetical protein